MLGSRRRRRAVTLSSAVGAVDIGGFEALLLREAQPMALPRLVRFVRLRGCRLLHEEPDVGLAALEDGRDGVGGGG